MKTTCPFLKFLFLLGVMASVYGATASPLTRRLARVNVAGLISQVPFPVFAQLQDASGQDYVWVKATEDELTRSGLSIQIIAEVNPDGRFYLAQSRRPVNLHDLPATVRIFHNDGRNLLLSADNPADRETLWRLGFELRGLPSTPMILTAPSVLVHRLTESAISSNALVSAMMDQIKMTNLYTMVCELSGAWPAVAGGSFSNIPTRNTQQPTIDRALDYASSHLQALGLNVSFHNWSTYDFWTSSTISNRNIVAVQTGITAPSEIVVICGHIDDMPSGLLAPGADDNASGSIGVLAAATAMRRYSFDRTIRYVLFTGEEQGLLGSEAYASAIYTAGDNVVGVYNLDMLAYDSNSDGKLMLNTRTASAPGYAADMEVASIFTNVVQLYGLNGMLNPIIASYGEEYSDHASFWYWGYPAILAIENTMDDFTPYYHTTNDLVQTLNFPYFTAFAKATVGAAAHLAGPRERVRYDAEVSNAVHAVRLELEEALGKPVPSLSVVLQTSDAEYFVSDAATPEQALATNTTFRFASNTKNFTATAVLHLQQHGLLNITNRIVDFIPGTDQPFISGGPHWAIPHKEQITIEQLLRHSAGVYDVDNDEVPGCGGTSYTDFMVTQNPGHSFSSEELVGQAALHQLSYFSPGEGYHYSNTGYSLLAEIVARVYSRYTGESKTLSDYLYEKILVDPAIRFPNVASDTELPPPFMPGTIYMSGGGSEVISNCNMSAQVGEGNGYGTLPALNHHIRTLMKGEGVLNSNMIHLMRTNTSSHNANYAMGCEYRPGLGFGHNGSRVGNLSLMAYNPENDVSVAVYLPLLDLSNGVDSFMLCINAMYAAAARALAAIDVPAVALLKEGGATNLSLSVSQTNSLVFIAAKDIYYGVYVANATAAVHLAVSPSVDPSSPIVFTNGLGWTCPATGTFRLDISSPSYTSADIRLYTLTNTIARVSSLITTLMASNNLVGCGFSLVDGSHTVLETGFGYADRENAIPVDENTIFMIGSCSKTFGAIAAMQLVERGLLDLDAPLTNALPTFSIHQRFAGNVITPRMILTHHSGLPGDIFNGGFTVRPNLAASAQVEAMLADEYTLMPTNTFWSYNNSGLVMLGLAIEHLSGMSSDAYATSNLFQRMGMTHSRLRRSAKFDFQSIARPYGGDRRCPEEYCNLEFAGSILSSASDMARYMKTILAGGMGENARVISSNTLNSMLVKQNAGIPLDQFNSILNMGIGFILDPTWLNYMGKVCWHDGGTLYFRTLMRVATDAQLGCFISWNTAEAAAVNGKIVDSALKWAYEEKTGIAPPVPCDLGTPAPAMALPETLALATGGVFVTASGYDIFATNDTGLSVRFNAQTDSSDVHSLIYRENGWFTPTNSYATQFQFTQSVGRILCIIKDFSNGVTNTTVHGERAIDISPYHAAWSNRLGRWWATDMYPGDVSWIYPGALTVPMLDLSTKDNMLLLNSGWFVMSATNDVIAFAAGLGRNKGSSLRVDGNTLSFMGIHYQSADSVPTLLPGASTNGMTTGDENAWISVPAPVGATFTVDLATECEITAWLYDTNSVYLGQANRSHAYRFDATNAQPLMIAIVRDGTNIGPWQLTIHTNEVPFYQARPFAQWPATLAEKSSLFPNTDFGYVFVPENRTNQTGNVLKIAVARMNSPKPSAQPLFFCSGGPGDSGIRNTYQHFLQTFTNDYDVYLFDQRGLGYSQPSLTTTDDEKFTDMQYRLTLLHGSDLSAINTMESSYDIDDLVNAFAITNVNLHGLSYGTLLAQTLMRREPDWLRAVILDGVVAPNIPPFSQIGPIRNSAISALFSDVAAHPLASGYYPNFPMTFYTLATNLQNNPVTIRYSGITNQVDGLAYLGAVLQQLTVSDIGTRERIPNITYRAAAGETAALAELYTGFNLDTNVLMQVVMSDAMQAMVINHDLLPFESMVASSNACAEIPSLLRQLSLNFMQQVIDITRLFDPVGKVDSSFTLPVTSTIPTLVINGTYDTQTGTNWATEVGRHLPNSHLVIVPTVGHGVLYGGPYPLQIMREFLADPSRAPDTSCLTNMHLDFAAPWPTHISALALGQPVTNTFANAGEAAWYRFTAVSGLYYNMGMDLGSIYARIVDSAGRDVNGASAGKWLAPENGDYYAWLIAKTSGVVRVDWTCPLMVRDISISEGNFVFNWQGITNMAFDIWMSTNLTERSSYVKVATNLPSTGWMNSFTNRMDVPAAFWFPVQAVP